MAMSLSLAVTAGAAFTDQDDVNYGVAVDTMVELGVINGYTDGSFKPEGNVTRAEAAKMITIALNGGKEPVLSASATPTYTDIAGHWAAKYIEYCTSLGIVAGDGAGKFNPNGNVKAVELAKMLLIAIGYDADTEKFVGANWDTNVNVIASQKDLYEDLETIDPSVAATRDTAAQMVWNALNVLMVEYDYKLTTVNGTLTSELVVKDIAGQTLLTKKFGTLPTEGTTGVMISAKYDVDDAEYIYTTEAGVYTTEADYTDLLGHNVTFVVKANADRDVYGAFAADSAVAVSGLVDDIDATDVVVTGDVASGSFEVADVEYDVDPAIAVVKYTASNHEATGIKIDGNAAQVMAAVEPYFAFEAIDWDDDDDIDLVVVYPAIMKEVTYVHADYIKVAEVGATGGDKLDTEETSDWVVYDGIAKEDIVRVAADTTLKTLGTVTKMEAVKGEVSSVTTSKDTAIVDGTTYNYTKAASDETMKTYLEETIEFYVINGFMFNIDADVAADLSDFVILADKSATAGLGNYYDAEIVFTDGTIEVVKAKAATGTTLTPDKLYTYEVEDGKYELTAAELTTEEFDVVGNSTITMTAADKDADTVAKINGYKFADDAVVLVKTEDGYVLKTGADLAKVTDTTAKVNYYGANTSDKTNVTNVAFAVVETEGTSVGEWQYGFVTSEVETKANTDGDYSVLTVWNGAESVELTTKAGVVADTDKGGVVKFKVDEEGLVSQIADLSKVANAAVAGAVTVIDGDEITVKYAGGTVPFTVDEDDTVVIYVDKSENTGMPADEIVLADKNESNVEINNVYIYDVEFDKTLEVIVVDVDNDWNAAQ